jgi:outer membrane murein-binding lipoprotein Lpp
MNTFRYVIFVVCAGALIVAGCSRPEPPSVRQSRLIAAENMELRKQIEQLNVQIETLKAQQARELEEQKKLLAAAKEEIEGWKEKSRQNVRVQVQNVLDTVIQENSELHKEIEQLNSVLETQRARISELEKALEEKPSE